MNTNNISLHKVLDHIPLVDRHNGSCDHGIIKVADPHKQYKAVSEEVFVRCHIPDQRGSQFIGLGEFATVHKHH